MSHTSLSMNLSGDALEAQYKRPKRSSASSQCCCRVRRSKLTAIYSRAACSTLRIAPSIAQSMSIAGAQQQHDAERSAASDCSAHAS